MSINSFSSVQNVQIVNKYQLLEEYGASSWWVAGDNYDRISNSAITLSAITSGIASGYKHWVPTTEKGYILLNVPNSLLSGFPTKISLVFAFGTMTKPSNTVSYTLFNAGIGTATSEVPGSTTLWLSNNYSTYSYAWVQNKSGGYFNTRITTPIDWDNSVVTCTLDYTTGAQSCTIYVTPLSTGITTAYSLTSSGTTLARDAFNYFKFGAMNDTPRYTSTGFYFRAFAYFPYILSSKQIQSITMDKICGIN